MPNEQENSSANSNQASAGLFDTTANQAAPVSPDQPERAGMGVPSEVEPSTSSLEGSATAERPALAVPVTSTEQKPPAGTSGTYSGPSSNPTNGLSMAPKKSNKRLIVATIVAGVLTLLIGGSVAAYNLWYQNPDKVISDALGNALTATSASTDSAMTVTSDDGTGTSTYDLKLTTLSDLKDLTADVSFNGKTADASFDMSASLVVKENERLYVKVNKLKELIEQSGLQAFIGGTPSVTNLITKLDGSWVVINTKELEETAGTKDNSSQCVEDSLKKLRTDAEYSKDVRVLYEKYPLIGVKNTLGSKDGSLGYEIEIKRDNGVKFVNGINSTKFFADLQKCDDSIEKLDGEAMFKQDAETDSDTKLSKFVVWVDRWTHQFTKLEINGASGESSGTLTTNLKFNVPVSVEAPKNPITIDELKSDIETIQQEMMQAAESGMMQAPMMDTSGMTSSANFEI